MKTSYLFKQRNEIISQFSNRTEQLGSNHAYDSGVLGVAANGRLSVSNSREDSRKVEGQVGAVPIYIPSPSKFSLV